MRRVNTFECQPVQTLLNSSVDFMFVEAIVQLKSIAHSQQHRKGNKQWMVKRICGCQWCDHQYASPSTSTTSGTNPNDVLLTHCGLVRTANRPDRSPQPPCGRHRGASTHGSRWCSESARETSGRSTVARSLSVMSR